MTIVGETPPIVATSVVYALGIALTYIGNASWSFKRERSHIQSVLRYIIVYVLGYLVQAGALLVLHNKCGVPHLIAQICAMLGAALTIFALLSYWVFRSSQRSGPQAEAE